LEHPPIKLEEKMICHIEVIENDAGKVVHLGCSKVLSQSNVYDWETDGLPPRLKERALKYLGEVFQYLKGRSS
jgi:hypothetical protein